MNSITNDILSKIDSYSYDQQELSDSKNKQLLKLVEQVFNSSDERLISHASQKWNTKFISVIKKDKEEQFTSFLTVIRQYLSEKEYKNKATSLYSKLENINGILSGTTLLDLKSSISEKKESICIILMQLEEEDLDQLKVIIENEFPLFQNTWLEARYFKQIQTIRNVDEFNPKDHLKLTSLISEMLKKMDPHLLLRITKGSFEGSKNQNKLSMNIKTYGQSIHEPILAQLEEAEKNQILAEITQTFLKDPRLYPSALMISYLISDCNERAKIIQEGFQTDIHQKSPTEKALLDHAKDLLYSVEVFDLILELIEDSTIENRKNILAILISTTENRWWINYIAKEELKISQPTIAPLIDRLVDTSLKTLFPLLVGRSKQERTGFVYLFSLIPYATRESGLPIFGSIALNTDLEKFDSQLELSVDKLKIICENISSSKTLEKMIQLVEQTSIEKRSQLIDHLFYFFIEGVQSKQLTAEIKTETLQLLLDIPYHFWPDQDSLSHILDKRQILREIAKIVQESDPELISNKIDLLMKTPEFGEQDWQCYVVRNKGFATEEIYNNTESNQNQKKYGQLMHQATIATYQLLENKKPGFAELLTFVGAKRSMIATNLKHLVYSEIFGKIRTTGSSTPCRDDTVYRKLKNDLIEIGSNLKTGKLVSDNVVLSSNKNYDFKKIGKINGEMLKLSFIKFYPSSVVIITHTHASEMEKILPYLESLYTKLLEMDVKEEKDKEQLLKISGEFFWWFCEAKPVQRGDPSMAEIMLRAIWKLKGLNNPPWQEDLVPWAETVKALDPIEFGENFHRLFEGSF